jgi:hypothetical protein
MISRRKFFSFFGTGVAMLAKPDLFIPKTGIQAYNLADIEIIRERLLLYGEVFLEAARCPVFMLAE